MRVLEPHHFKRATKKRKRFSRQHMLVVQSMGLVCALALLYVLFGQDLISRINIGQQTSPAHTPSAPHKPKQLKHFTAEQFKQSYSTYRYPNTQPITAPPEITGNATADARVRRIAEARGYKLTALPVASIVQTKEPSIEGNDLIQPNALLAWQDLKTAAAGDDIVLTLTSAYRSIDFQRTLFLRRLQAAGVHEGRILEGYADDEIDAVLSRAAPPGYSRHHTGYTIDLSCNGVGLDSFRTTSCYSWLSANNFENAKKFGWVPSYPEGAGDSGPEPEPWEYVWIGTGATYE